MSLQINIEEILQDIKNTLESLYNEKYPEIKEVTETYLQASKERLLSLSNDYLSGQLTSEFFLARIEDEKAILESQLLSYKVMGISLAKEISEVALNLLVQSIQKLLNS